MYLNKKCIVFLEIAKKLKEQQKITQPSVSVHLEALEQVAKGQHTDMQKIVNVSKDKPD